MDFVEGLPKSEGRAVIFVVVDRFSKYAHFMAMPHPYTACSVARMFLDNIYKLHGFPATIVSDKDTVFRSLFWKELFARQGVKLCHSTAYHPQSDGQTEVVNKCLENYLRCMTGSSPTQWVKWLPLAEWW
jgi:IS30 family transposase